jgi:hypothetical protein
MTQIQGWIIVALLLWIGTAVSRVSRQLAVFLNKFDFVHHIRGVEWMHGVRSEDR